MSVQTITDNIKKFSNMDLSAFARHISNQKGYEDLKDVEELTQSDMDKVVNFAVKQLMRENLLIPSNGTAINLIEVAENMWDDTEFGDKYSGEGL